VRDVDYQLEKLREFPGNDSMRPADCECRRAAMEERRPEAIGVCSETVVFWWCGLADYGEIHEGLNGGAGTQGIFAVRPELLVPFAGAWAA
jgi:hypothetical protein